MTLSFQDIQQQLTQKQLAPLYFLYGDEAFFIDEIVKRLEQEVLEEHEKDFNQSIVYGKDTDAASLVMLASRAPMMAERQLVIVKEAQHIKDIDKLKHYVTNPIPSTILVLAYKHKKIDKRKQFFKLILKQAACLESNKLREYEVGPWVTQLLKQEKVQYDAQVPSLLSAHLGTDLSKIYNEVQKLVLAKQATKQITVQDIETYVGISRDYNVFELQKAVVGRQQAKAYEIAFQSAKFMKNMPLIMVITILFRFFSKLYQYQLLVQAGTSNIDKAIGLPAWQLKDYQLAATKYTPAHTEQVIRIIHQFDLKAKGVDNPSTKEDALLQELVCEIVTV